MCTLSSTYIHLTVNSALLTVHCIVVVQTVQVTLQTDVLTSAVCENAALGKFIEVQRLTEQCTKTVTKGLTLLYNVS